MEVTYLLLSPLKVLYCLHQVLNSHSFEYVTGSNQHLYPLYHVSLEDIWVWISGYYKPNVFSNHFYQCSYCNFCCYYCISFFYFFFFTRAHIATLLLLLLFSCTPSYWFPYSINFYIFILLHLRQDTLSSLKNCLKMIKFSMNGMRKLLKFSMYARASIIDGMTSIELNCFKHFYRKQIIYIFIWFQTFISIDFQADLFDPWMWSKSVLTLQVRVELGVMPMKQWVYTHLSSRTKISPPNKM